LRHAVEQQRGVGQQRGGHDRQGGILAAGNRHAAVEYGGACDLEHVHVRTIDENHERQNAD
jgi:hypothetical protein